MSSTTLRSTTTARSNGGVLAGRTTLLATALLSSVSMLAAWPLALMAVPQSGPWCREARCVTYPFTDVEYRVIDFAWMYPAILGLAAFAVLIALLDSGATHRLAAARLARLTCEYGVGILVITYALQLMVVQPGIIKGEQEALSFWTQYNPHGGFVALENLGYLMLCVGLIAIARTVPGRGAGRRTVRLTAGGLGALGVLLLPVMASLLGSRLEYLYEVSVISLVWVGIIVVAPLLALTLPARPDAEGVTAP